jgi:dTDP-4-amino-4,6-dideoxygalactose transaminase
MKIPLLDLKSQLSPIREKIVAAVTKVIDSTSYIQGPEVIALECEIASYGKVASATGVSSGTDALLVALMALNIGPGDRVLTTAYSFFATMGVILRCGAHPVFADIDPISYNIDPLSIAKLLEADTDKTIKAIIPVHLYGQCADMDAIMALSREYQVPVIEDAAQAIGAEYPNTNGEWQKSGSMGLVGCFSFFPSKNLGGIGDGGMVVSNDTEYGELLKILRNHGAKPKYFHARIGGNFRLDPIQATVLRIKLTHLEDWHQARRTNAEQYNKLFGESGLVSDEKLSPPVAVYKEKAGQHNYHIYNQYVIRVQKRDDLIDYLRSKDIGCEIYYPLCLHQQECLQGLVAIPELPHAEEAARSTIAIPIYPELTPVMQEYVVEQITRFYKEH